MIGIQMSILADFGPASGHVRQYGKRVQVSCRRIKEPNDPENHRTTCARFNEAHIALEHDACMKDSAKKFKKMRKIPP